MSNITTRGSSESVAYENLKRKQVEQLADALVNYKGSLVTAVPDSILRLFDAKERERVKGEILILQDEIEARRKLLQLYNEGQFNAVRELIDNNLIKFKASARADIIAHVAEQIRIVESKTLEIRTDLDGMFDKEMNAISAINNEIIRKRREDSLVKTIIRYNDMLDQMLDNFKDSIPTV